MSTELPHTRRLAAIMFTDIVGYSAMTQRNESLALLLLSEHNRLIRDLLPAHGGKVIKTVGDAFLVEFGSALDAVRAAMAIQNALHSRNASVGIDPIHVRIGVHLGDVVYRENDVFGDGVNIASRIQSISAADGICISEDVARQVQNKIDAPLLSLGTPALKNIEQAVGVYAIQLPWTLKASGKPVKSSGSATLRHVILGGAMVASALLAGSTWWYSSRATTPVSTLAGAQTQSNSIAILPFTNMSANKDDDFFGDGMTEDLLTQLAHISGLKVISRTSVMQYKGTKKSIREIARELGVVNILEGSVRRGDNRYRITAQLINAENDKHLWAKSYDRDFKDVLGVQAELTAEIAAALKVVLRNTEMEFLSQHAKGNAEAYLHYLKGRDLIRPQYRQPREQIELARAEFEKVVELDPASPLGYVGLAIYHIRIPSFGGPPAPVSNATAETFIMKAITRDSRSVDALVILSLLRGFGQWRWHEAEQAARQAIELSPGNAYAWDIYRASVLQPMGRLREAVDAQLRARSLDPNNDNYARVIIGLYAQLRQYDDAMAEAKSLLAKEPANPGNHALMATILEYQAKYAEAIAEFRLAKLSKNSFPADSDLDLLEKALAAKGANGYHATRYALQRQRAEAAQGTWYQTAMAAASAGEHDEAFIYLDRAFKEFDRGLPWLKVEIAFDPIRKDPRFLTMLKRLNLE